MMYANIAALLLTTFGQLDVAPGYAPPVSTIESLSLPASEDSPAMVLRIYRLRPATKDHPRPTADELAEVVRELFAPESWDSPGAYLREVNDCLIVRQSAQVQREVHALLLELHALPGGLRGSVIPVVGGRRDHSAQR
jgi:hypothetical protein